MIDESPEATAARIRKVRSYFGRPEQTQADFAQSYFGIQGTTWSNYETGTRPGLDQALQMVRKQPLLSLDWIYRGDPKNMAPKVYLGLEAAPEPPSRTTLKSGRRS